MQKARQPIDHRRLGALPVSTANQALPAYTPKYVTPGNGHAALSLPPPLGQPIQLSIDALTSVESTMVPSAGPDTVPTPFAPPPSVQRLAAAAAAGPYSLPAQQRPQPSHRAEAPGLIAGRLPQPSDVLPLLPPSAVKPPLQEHPSMTSLPLQALNTLRRLSSREPPSSGPDDVGPQPFQPAPQGQQSTLASLLAPVPQRLQGRASISFDAPAKPPTALPLGTTAALHGAAPSVPALGTGDFFRCLFTRNCAPDSTTSTAAAAAPVQPELMLPQAMGLGGAAAARGHVTTGIPRSEDGMQVAPSGLQRFLPPALRHMPAVRAQTMVQQARQVRTLVAMPALSSRTKHVLRKQRTHGRCTCSFLAWIIFKRCCNRRVPNSSAMLCWLELPGSMMLACAQRQSALTWACCPCRTEPLQRSGHHQKP